MQICAINLWAGVTVQTPLPPSTSPPPPPPLPPPLQHPPAPSVLTTMGSSNAVTWRPIRIIFWSHMKKGGGGPVVSALDGQRRCGFEPGQYTTASPIFLSTFISLVDYSSMGFLKINIKKYYMHRLLSRVRGFASKSIFLLNWLITGRWFWDHISSMPFK